MKQKIALLSIGIISILLFYSFAKKESANSYSQHFENKVAAFNKTLDQLISTTKKSDLSDADVNLIKKEIHLSRLKLKSIDFWIRYLDPNSYKKINGPLPIEWETEVFEKYEKPYKREGAGLTLAELYLDESAKNKASLLNLLEQAQHTLQIYKSDSILKLVASKDNFFLCNRLHILNLAAIYTTSFECPDTSRVIPELKSMMIEIETIYQSFNQTFSATPLTNDFLQLYKKAVEFLEHQPIQFSVFNHYTFIREFINPLFSINQNLIRTYQVVSKNNVDYSLNKNSQSIFSKNLYNAQNTKGIFLRVYDEAVLNEIKTLGKLLFYDPILSGNNNRSCASCHNSQSYYTDTLSSTALHFNEKQKLKRNTPSLLNVPYNHLLMYDGKHTTLQNQAKAVISNPDEMNCLETDALNKVLSCKEYKKGFEKLLQYTPQEKKVSIEHIVSALTLYYSKFSNYYAPFDLAMNKKAELNTMAQQGFNLFMSKAQCATCHFVPQFNGVKPPYIGSEFEVLGVPFDSLYTKLNSDLGRNDVHSSNETKQAFRTGNIRNIERTKPYMHNGVFSNLNQVLDFYDGGGGIGHGFVINNQTLSSDSLHLSKLDKEKLMYFFKSLNEDIPLDMLPEKLPLSNQKKLNNRKVGGTY